MGFTETPLGRFLVAIEHYILILYVLIYAFYRNPNKATNDPTATIPAPADNTEFPTATCIRPSNISSPVTRPSTVHRVSSWISRRVSGRPDSDQLRRWNAPQDIEAVSASPATLTALVEKISLDDFKGADPTFPYALRRDRRSFEEEEIEQADRSSPNLVRISYATTQADNTENMDSPPMDHLMPVPSAYASPQQGQSLMLPRARESALSSESPIYGLAGIITNPSSRSTTPGPLLTQSPPRPQPQRASTGTTIFPSDSSPGSASRLSSLRRAPTYPLRSAHRVAVTTSSSYSTRSPTSEYCPASPYAASEFSLSHFPIPPTPASAPLTTMTVARRSSMTLLPPVMKEKVGATTFPNTVHGLGESFGSSAELVYGGGAGDGSNGLRLDVTSFIGGQSSCPIENRNF